MEGDLININVTTSVHPVVASKAVGADRVVMFIVQISCTVLVESVLGLNVEPSEDKNDHKKTPMSFKQNFHLM